MIKCPVCESKELILNVAYDVYTKHLPESAFMSDHEDVYFKSQIICASCLSKELLSKQIKVLRMISGSGLQDVHDAIVLCNYDLIKTLYYLKYKGCAINLKGKTKDEWIFDKIKNCKEEEYEKIKRF